MTERFEVIGSAVPAGTCAAWLARIDDAYRDVGAAPPGAYVAESSSFRLGTVAGLAVEEIWEAVPSSVHQRCRDALGPMWVLDADQCWIRRQHRPDGALARHRPHSWHQDGALGFDFVGLGDAPVPADALLRMITVWIPLVACGVDAPGLEIVTDPIETLLRPTNLGAGAIDRRWPPPRRVRPLMGAGDAAIFAGDVLHRTAWSPTMTRTRTSIELRCFPVAATAGRLRADRFLSVG